jgi:lipid-binding SYLF domain-containing protein
MTRKSDFTTRRRWLALALLLALAVSGAMAGEEKRAAKRARLDANAVETLDELFAKSEGAKALFEEAHAYAVFNVIKVSLGITGGGGNGVAVNKGTGKRTYMKMGTGGLNLGLGGQSYAIVFLFQTEKAFESFLSSGWQADAGANAVAGTAGANAAATFKNGVAYWVLTEAGLMLQADITGTKYWKNKKLN